MSPPPRHGEALPQRRALHTPAERYASSCATFCKFISEEVEPCLVAISTALMRQLAAEERIDLDRSHMDGTKSEANTNRCKRAWKKAGPGHMRRWFPKATKSLETMVRETGAKFPTGKSRTVGQFEACLAEYVPVTGADTSPFVHRAGTGNTAGQRRHEERCGFLIRPQDYWRRSRSATRIATATRRWQRRHLHAVQERPHGETCGRNAPTRTASCR